MDVKRHSAKIASYHESMSAPKPAKRLELPFRVRIVRNDAQLEQAVRIRAEAYSRHVPTLGEVLAEPEPVDAKPRYAC